MVTSEFQVTGMTCGHCEAAVRAEVGGIPGVEEIQVSARTGDLVVVSVGPLADADVVAAVREAGYSGERV